MVIFTFLCFFFFFDGLEAEKQNVGLSRTDSRHAAGAENFYYPLLHKFVTPYLEFTRTLHQDTKTYVIKMECFVKCSLGKIYQF